MEKVNENMPIAETGNPNCPNNGIAELLSGNTFGNICCEICEKNPEQVECVKAQIVKRGFPPNQIKGKNKEQSIYQL